MTNPNDPSTGFFHESTGLCIGLTKREYFAAMALHGILANEKYVSESIESRAGKAVWSADALINALNNPHD